ncbi:MAG: ATP-dependent DNA helicase [Nanoarchaeales archaeon]|nr:ATP-dependent DNA helicase [Nanoarchaeales archaeon]
METFFEKINFPYETVRAGQDKFIKYVFLTIKEQKNLMVSAPTGLGKTVSALAPAIAYAQKHEKTIICLTSRQTQANQVIKTIADINRKAKSRGKTRPIRYMAFIGKRNMCAHKDRDLYPASDFNEFCKKTRETGKCKFFINTKNEDNAEQIKEVIDESTRSVMNVEGFVNLAGGCKLCPYEVAGKKAFKADVVICDYNYLFSAGIRENFLGKIGRTIDECIVIVDEAHNLPDRIRSAHSYGLTTELLKNALKELQACIKDDSYDIYINNIRGVLRDIMLDKLDSSTTDYLVSKDEFIKNLTSRFLNTNMQDIIDKLDAAAALVKEDRIISFVERVSHFLGRWFKADEDSYLRILEKTVNKGETTLSLRIKCIDPSTISGDILNKSYSTILMSGTLTPIKMYRDILGVANCRTLEVESPFLSKNQLTIVDDTVTSRYAERSDEMFSKIAKNIEDALFVAKDKNTIVFFPSYDFLDKIVSKINLVGLNRKVLREQRYMNKEDKEKFVDSFKSTGAFDDKAKVLFGITSGSFAEGLDLPAKALEMVLVVGLPLAVPDTFTKAVIKHFDKKFGKGQMYGYIYPAMSKIIQAAGRCIRSEQDKGVVVLMDNRFMSPLYAQCFPWQKSMYVTKDLMGDIEGFFDSNDKDSLDI